MYRRKILGTQKKWLVRHGFHTFNLQSTSAIIIKYRGNTETLELPLCQAERNKVLMIELAFLFLILLSTPTIIIEYRGNIRYWVIMIKKWVT